MYQLTKVTDKDLALLWKIIFIKTILNSLYVYSTFMLLTCYKNYFYTFVKRKKKQVEIQITKDLL